jgi:hypothetical protein
MAELGVQELGGKAEEEKPRCKLKQSYFAAGVSLRTRLDISVK